LAGTISTLEAELEATRHNLAFKEHQVVVAAAELARMRALADRAQAQTVQVQERGEQLSQEAEQEVDRLHEELRAERLRAEAIQHRQRRELEVLRDAESQAREREQTLMQVAKEAPPRSGGKKMSAIESQWKGQMSSKEQKIEELSHSLASVSSNVPSGSALQAKYTSASIEAGQVKAEFDSFKAMTRRMIKQKDDELSRLRNMEDGVVVSGDTSIRSGHMGGSTSVGRNAMSAMTQAAKEARLLEVVQTHMETDNVLRRRLFSLGIILTLCVMVFMLYRTYLSAGSFICFLEIIGLKIGTGCGSAYRIARRASETIVNS